MNERTEKRVFTDHASISFGFLLLLARNVHEPAVSELAASIVPPALDAARVRERACVKATGPHGRDPGWEPLYIHGCSSGLGRAVSELAIIVGTPALDAARVR
jgi:hypothetical protein